MTPIVFTSTVQANPGYFVLGEICDERGFPVEADMLPVVAWAMEEGTLTPFPITLEGVQTGNVYILRPDGAVERPSFDGFLGVAEWLAAQQLIHTSRHCAKK